VKYLQDILFEDNVVYNTGSMIGLSGKDNHYYTPVFSNQITFRNNLFINQRDLRAMAAGALHGRAERHHVDNR